MKTIEDIIYNLKYGQSPKMCASVKLELSGRLRGVNMARKLK
jgi:hypothetical protein